jgi:16S rRNA (cytosine967-C5)-methyltransferase
MKNDRLQALFILIKLLQDKTPLLHLIQSDKALSPFSKELCFGVSRQYIRLEALAGVLLKKRPKQVDIWLILLLGLYQLHFLNKPDYAVVKETVSLLDTCKKPWAKGLVNAVLRNYCREREALLAKLANNKPFTHGHPQWLVKRLQHDWPQDWQTILHANDQHSPMSLRVNANKTTATHYLNRLQQVQLEAHVLSHAPNGVALVKPCDVQDLPGFVTGDVSVQDEAAQLAVTLLDLQPGLRVLDACCAPGGKTGHILETQDKLAFCLALDIDQKRLERVRENLNRLQLSATLQIGNGLHPETWWDGQPFDRILLDAPCSATGVIRRHPDIKLLRTAADVSTVAQTQRHLLHALWPLLKPGGSLVYATCSILLEENEQQIQQFIQTQSNCQFTPIEQTWGRLTGHGWQILPGENNMDGFFYSVLKKTSVRYNF